MSGFASLRNRLLIAMPGMKDPNFIKGVALVCEHTEEGALAILINQPISLTFSEVLSHMDLPSGDDDLGDKLVLFGGPVQQERGFVIHKPIGKWRASLPVNEDVAVTASRDVLEAISESRGPKKMLTCLGYTGWGAGQLEQEMADNLWLDVPLDETLIFDVPYEGRWKAAAKLLGFDIAHLSGEVGHG